MSSHNDLHGEVQQSYFQEMPMPELLSLLADKSELLLESIAKKDANARNIARLNSEVEMLQKIIMEKKKANRS